MVWALAKARKLCLPIAMLGPFCSVPPDGRITVVLPAAMASRISNEVIRSIRTLPAPCAKAGAKAGPLIRSAATNSSVRCIFFSPAPARGRAQSNRWRSVSRAHLSPSLLTSSNHPKVQLCSARRAADSGPMIADWSLETARPARGSSPWVAGPAWDAVWMQSALWLTPLALWLVHGSGSRSGPLDTLYFAITALFWIGHRLGSAWLAYGTEAYRPLLRAQPARFVVLPLLVTAACFAIFLPPDTALPFTRMERFIGLAILDYAASTWHFGAQHFGALSLYRARAGHAGCSRTRRRDRLFALGVGGVLVFLADALAGAAAYQNLWLNRWLPANFVSLLEPVRDGATVLL